MHEVPQAHDAPHDSDQPEVLKAVGELAAENADLYRKIGELTHALKTEQGRFGTWAKEVARDREQAAQDKAEMAERLDKVLAMNEALAHRVADLEQERADQSPVTSAGAPERRIGAEEGVARQTDRKQLRRLNVSNEVISVGTMGVSTAATVMADVLGSAVAGDAAGIAGNALGLAAAVIAQGGQEGWASNPRLRGRPATCSATPSEASGTTSRTPPRTSATRACWCP